MLQKEKSNGCFVGIDMESKELAFIFLWAEEEQYQQNQNGKTVAETPRVQRQVSSLNMKWNKEKTVVPKTSNI